MFTLGNHEFDDGDANLTKFLDFLNSDPACDTAAIAANVIPAAGSRLAPNTPTDYIQPCAIEEFDGQQVCVVQAWQYSWVVGDLGVTFQEGQATGCDGRATP